MDFSIFSYKNRYGTGPFDDYCSPFDFEFEFAKIFIIEFRLPAINEAAYRWYRESATPRIVDIGESIFNYDYILEFES
jgi:hypothetical protein